MYPTEAMEADLTLRKRHLPFLNKNEKNSNILHYCRLTHFITEIRSILLQQQLQLNLYLLFIIIFLHFMIIIITIYADRLVYRTFPHFLI